MPNLDPVFDIERNANGGMAVQYSNGDRKLYTVMQVGSQDHDEHEVQLSAPGNISFDSKQHFYPGGRFRINLVQIRATLAVSTSV